MLCCIVLHLYVCSCTFSLKFVSFLGGPVDFKSNQLIGHVQKGFGCGAHPWRGLLLMEQNIILYCWIVKELMLMIRQWVFSSFIDDMTHHFNSPYSLLNGYPCFLLAPQVTVRLVIMVGCRLDYCILLNDFLAFDYANIFTGNIQHTNFFLGCSLIQLVHL